MGYDYSDFYALAVRQITDKGRDIVYRSVDEGDYDTASGTVSSDTYTDYPIKALEVRPKFNQYTRLDPTINERFDKEFMIDAAVVTPRQKDIIIDGDIQYQIVKIAKTQPGDTIIYYNLRVKL